MAANIEAVYPGFVNPAVQPVLYARMNFTVHDNTQKGRTTST